MSNITDPLSKGQTLVDLVQFWGKRNPNYPDFIFWSPSGRRVLSRGDVLDLSSRFASRLNIHGVKPGEVVCIALPNSPERVVVEFGVHFAGAVSLNGQVLRVDGEDLIETLNKSKCSCIVLDPNQKSGAWQVCRNAFDSFQIHENHIEIQSQRIPTLKTAFICKHSEEKNSFLAGLHEDAMKYEGATPQDISTIFTTSGSTGYSKLVLHTHKALLSYAHSMGPIIGFQQGIKFFNCSPLGWLGGFPVLFLYHGCCLVSLDESHGGITQKAAFIWDVIRRENVQVAGLTPSIIEAITEHVPDADLRAHALTTIITGGQPVTKDHISDFEKLSDSVTVVYGATEFCLATLLNIDTKNPEGFQDEMAGYPLPGVQIQVVDKDLKTVPPQSRGEILVRSSMLSTGYVGADTTAQKNFLPDGWFKTGDISFMKEDGCLFVVGRSCDAIMHGAYILYPTWLEQKLINCPGVKEVVIVPVPDKILHHEICACVHLNDTTDVLPTAEDIINFCKHETVLDESSNLNTIPKYVLFFTEFPLTITDKLDRRRLADLAKEQLQL